MNQIDEWVSAGESWRSVPCKIWTKSLNSQGYGKVWYEGHCINAHRREYLLHYGSIPEDFVVMHRCHNRPCYEIKHLEVGTQQENTSDAALIGMLGRDTTGERNPNSKLNEQDVCNILDLFYEGEMSKITISSIYSVSSQLIGQIVRGKRWSHI